MASKENKGGILSNEQVERDNQVKGKHTENGQYQGAQDTGDKDIRSMGTDVQRRDGTPSDDHSNE